VLAALEAQLGLESGALFALRALDEQSETSVCLHLSLAQTSPEYDCITLGGHRDIRTMTLLSNIVRAYKFRLLEARMSITIGDT
jgi:hypothetical protein